MNKGNSEFKNRFIPCNLLLLDSTEITEGMCKFSNRLCGNQSVDKLCILHYIHDIYFG